MSPLVRPLVRSVALAALVCVALAACPPSAGASAGLARGRARLSKPVKTVAGLVAGTLTADGAVAVFRGIPYAAPPIGDMRWKAPGPPVPWAGVRSAAEFGAACAQAERGGTDRLARTSEDCLYLNVWAPVRLRGSRAPVLVWFHGGAFTHGTAATGTLDGESLARRGAVVVTFNYRLGPFGFFAHPLLTSESGHDASGNYGLLDQIAALQWVKANVRAFNGNPDRVTLVGEAAGAVSISCLMVSPMTRGLFHAAILQSGSALSISRVGVSRYLNDAPAGEESMEEVGELIARRLGCDHEDDVLAALRARTTDEVLSASRPAQNFFGDGLRFGPIVDRWLLPDRPSLLFERGRQHKMPVIVGANAEEGVSFAAALQPWTVESYRRFVRGAFRDRADEVLARYPASRDVDARLAAARLISAAAFIAPARRTAKAMADLGARTYLYWFTRTHASPSGTRPAAHGSELPYLFDSARPQGEWDESDRELSSTMIRYWVRFAASGDPNAEGAPQWPRYQSVGDISLELDVPAQAREAMYKDVADFFDRLAADRPAAGTPGRPSR
jgi:para-nitrobenzyl esterase